MPVKFLSCVFAALLSWFALVGLSTPARAETADTGKIFASSFIQENYAREDKRLREVLKSSWAESVAYPHTRASITQRMERLQAEVDSLEGVGDNNKWGVSADQVLDYSDLLEDILDEYELELELMDPDEDSLSFQSYFPENDATVEEPPLPDEISISEYDLQWKSLKRIEESLGRDFENALIWPRSFLAGKLERLNELKAARDALTSYRDNLDAQGFAYLVAAHECELFALSFRDSFDKISMLLSDFDEKAKARESLRSYITRLWPRVHFDQDELDEVLFDINQRSLNNYSHWNQLEKILPPAREGLAAVAGLRPASLREGPEGLSLQLAVWHAADSLEAAEYSRAFVRTKLIEQRIMLVYAEYEMLSTMPKLWADRYDIYHGQNMDSAKAESLLHRIESSLALLYLQRDSELRKIRYLTDCNETLTRLINESPPEIAQMLRQIQADLSGSVFSSEAISLLRTLDEYIALLEIITEEIERKYGTSLTMQRMRQRIEGTASSIWQMVLIDHPDFRLTLGDALLILCLSLMCALVAKYFSRMVEKLMVRAFKVRPGLALLIRRLLFGSVLMIGFFIILEILDLPTAVFVFIVGGLVVALSLGTRNLVSSLLDGLSATLTNAVEKGDLVQSEGIFGRVVKVTPRAFIVNTFDERYVRVPMEALYRRNFINFRKYGCFARNRTRVDVPAMADHETVSKLLVNIARSAEYIVQKPEERAPFVQVVEIFNGYVRYELCYWFDTRENGPVRTASELRQAILAVFARNHIPLSLIPDWHTVPEQEDAALALPGPDGND